MTISDPPALTAFVARFDAFAASAGLRPGALSSRLFGASDRVAEIRAGRDVGVRTLHRASEALAALEAQAADAARAGDGPVRRRGPAEAGAAGARAVKAAGGKA